MKNSNVFYSWKTTKNEDGSFTGTTTKNTCLDAPVNGRYVSTETIGTYKRRTRATAKSAAIQKMRYAKAKGL